MAIRPTEEIERGGLSQQYCGQGYPPTPVGTTAQEARPQPWRMSHGGVWQIWAFRNTVLHVVPPTHTPGPRRWTPTASCPPRSGTAARSRRGARLLVLAAWHAAM